MASLFPGPEPRDDGGVALTSALNAEELKMALDVGRAGVWTWTHSGDGGALSGDQGLAALWGLPRGEPPTSDALLSSIDPDDRSRVERELRSAARPGGPDTITIEFRIARRGNEAPRWIALYGRRHRPTQGVQDAEDLIGMARDVTARRERETHLHLLMREVTHRSKNLLAIIQAMARQTVKDSLTATQFEERFSVRLRGLAASHDLLAARDWHGAPVGELVRYQVHSTLEAPGPRVTFSGPELFLKPEAAQNIGLAINELASNAARFGALSGPGGRVAVEWSLDPTDAEPRRFRISWTETGGPSVSEPLRSGFGRKVMERIAARALDGEVTLSFEPGGLRWALHVPATFVLEGEAPVSWN